jgi:hypothetical protein
MCRRTKRIIPENRIIAAIVAVDLLCELAHTCVSRFAVKSCVRLGRVTHTDDSLYWHKQPRLFVGAFLSPAVPTLEVRLDEVHIGEDRLREGCPTEVRIGEVRLVEVCPDEACPDEVRHATLRFASVRRFILPSAIQWDAKYVDANPEETSR